MYTGKQIFDLAMDLIGKRATTGQIDANKTKSYSVLAPGLLTLWQSEISKSGDLYKTFEIPNKPIANMVGVNAGFDYPEYQGKELIFEGNGSVKAYYFEVDGEGTVYIEDYNGSWNTLETIVVDSNVTAFTAFKGVVTPSTNVTKSRIRFTGPYRYLITNYAMFSMPISPTKVPNYQPWVKATLPSDLKSIDKVVTEYQQRQYAVDSAYKIEERNKFYYNYYFEGKIRVIYKPVPIQVLNLEQTLEVDEITSITGAYFLAANLMLQEDSEIASFFQQKYEELKLDSTMKQPATAQQIIDVYSITYGGD